MEPSKRQPQMPRRSLTTRETCSVSWPLNTGPVYPRNFSQHWRSSREQLVLFGTACPSGVHLEGMLECTPTPGAPAHMTREARPLSSDNGLALLHTSQVSKTSRCNNSRSRRHRAHSQGTESQIFDEIETFDTTRETRDRRAPASTYVRVHRQTCYLVQEAEIEPRRPERRQ